MIPIATLKTDKCRVSFHETINIALYHLTYTLCISVLVAHESYIDHPRSRDVTEHRARPPTFNHIAANLALPYNLDQTGNTEAQVADDTIKTWMHFKVYGTLTF